MTLLRVFRVEEGIGNACALIFPDNTLGIVDWGTQNEKAIHDLLVQTEITRVRFVAATHAHEDHTLGLVHLMKAFLDRRLPIDKFVYPTSTLRNSSRDHLLRAREFAFDHKIEMYSVSVIREGDKDRPLLLENDEDWEIRVLAPPASVIAAEELRGYRANKSPGNLTSLVLLYRSTNDGEDHGRALLPGDATLTTLKHAKSHCLDYPEYSLNNHALVVPHHGSSNNWSSWLAQYIHGAVIISAPPRNQHHPAKKVLESLAKHCHMGEDKSALFCTSYSHYCDHHFIDARTQPSDHDLVRHDACFGDITIELAPNGTSAVDHDPLGPERRRFGYCGNVNAKN
jgi:hypothetical protein